MTTEVTLASEPTQPAHRFGVLDAGHTNLVAKITLQADGDKAAMSVSADEPLATQLSDLCRNAAIALKAANPNAQGDFGLLIDAMRNALIGAGFEIRDLPESDFTMSFEFDQRTGRVLSREIATHEFASSDPDLLTRMQASIASVFERPLLELADTVQRHVTACDFGAAAIAVFEAQAEGRFFGNIPSQLLAAMKLVDVDALPSDHRLKFRRYRAAVAAARQDYISAEPDALALIAEDPAMDLEQRVSLQTGIAIAEMRKGHPEAALSIWRGIVNGPDTPTAGQRGWVWRNIAKALKRGEEALQAARLSADAFLEAGDAREAGASYMLESKILEHVSPSDALKKLDDILSVTTQGGLIGDQLLASIHHAKGNRLLELRQGAAALDEVLKAVTLRRGIAGAEEELISSLHLASLAAGMAAKPTEQAGYHEEAVRLETASGSKHFELANAIGAQLAEFDASTAETLLQAARATHQPHFISAATIAVVMGDKTLSDTTRLAKLEALLAELTERDAHDEDFQPALLSMAMILRRMGQPKRAIPYLERATIAKPLDLPAAKALAEAYQATEQWGEAAIAYRRLIDLFGAPPQAALLYSQALLNAGATSEAIEALQQLLDQEDLPDDVKSHAETLRTKAFRAWQGRDQSLPQKPSDVSLPVLKEDLSAALKEFAAFISAHKRMSFWKKKPDGSDYAWIQNPETHAQDLTHTFLKAHFKTRVSVFEELDIGAGRMDILLKFEGGLNAVLELKMCGYSYSSNYAAAGETQILHYMEQSGCHLGYLLVFDARLNDYGKQLLTPDAKGSNTVFEIFADLQPRVSARKGAK